MSAPTEAPAALRAFLREHYTLVVATEAEGQPWCTRVFFAETFERGELPTLYVLTKTPSRKLENLTANPRVGLFVGPDYPTAWLEARGTAEEVADPGEAARGRALVLAKAPQAEPFLKRVTAVTVRIEVGWLRLIDAATDPRLIVELGDEYDIPRIPGRNVSV
jgi:nitroimidazol reductase NimA-like FMN-containing flavoprotein (pyridoxamine 5'-phosphate oxidase superfamily)